MGSAVQPRFKGFFKPGHVLLGGMVHLSSAKPKGYHAVFSTFLGDRQRIFGALAVAFSIWNIAHDIEDPPDLYAKCCLSALASLCQSGKECIERDP